MPQPENDAYTVSEARQKFADVFNQALYQGPVYVRRYDKTVAVVSLDVLARLEELEDLADGLEALRAREEYQAHGGIELSDLLKE